MLRINLIGILFAAGCCAQASTVLPSGTSITSELLKPLWAKSARVGDTVNVQTTFPVVSADRMAIPPGTYLQGRLDVLIQPARTANRAEFRMHFNRMIFGSGYNIALDPDAAIATVTVRVERTSQVLLDGGSPVEITLAKAISLDPARVAGAGPLRTVQTAGAVCRPVKGTPGTPAVVIPGTPATPPTVIPGAPGMPDTVFPGVPGTDPVVIPGIEPTASRVDCPEPPRVIADVPLHSESFTLPGNARVDGHELASGHYEVSWDGLTPVTQARISKAGIFSSGAPISSGPASVIVFDKASTETRAELRNDPDGSVSLDSVRFKGQTYGLKFNP